MEKLLYFDYCSLVIQAILLVCLLMKNMLNGKRGRIYLVLLSFSVFTTGMDIFAVSFDNYGPGNIIPKLVFHTLYIVCHGMTGMVYLNYLFSLTDTWFKAERSKSKLIQIFLPSIFLCLLMISNIFNHKVFYFNEHDTYTRGDWFFLLYIVTAYYVIYIFYKVFKYRELMEKGWAASMYSCLVIMLTAVIIQYIYPYVLVEMFASAVGLLFILMMVQPTEEIIDSETELNKLTAYAADIKRSLINKKPETIIMVNIANYNSISRILNYDDMRQFKKNIASNILSYLKANKIKADVYYLDNGKYRIRTEVNYDRYAEQIAEYVNNYLKRFFTYNEIKINVIACVCIAHCPLDISDLESLLAFGNDLDTKYYTGDILYASQIFNQSRYNILRDIDRIIETAISENGFEVYYQPIYSVKNQKFTSAEALLRMRDKRYGYISPEIFIPAAEKSGAIHRIGQFVMESVCQFIASKEFDELELEYIEINLSPAQCMDSNLSNDIMKTLNHFKVKPEKINLEITETAATDLHSMVFDNIMALHKHGISLSLDDFGTGYSNMYRVASIPFRIIKLDKSITHIDENPNMLIVIENVIKMIKAMDMKILVEGIETSSLVRQFSEMDCEYIQSFYYSKPLPLEQFIAFIQRNLNHSEVRR